MTVDYQWDLVQGTDEWHQARIGILTSSEMKHVITPTLKIANNDKTRAHLYEIVAQRAVNNVEDQFESWDMLRGKQEEVHAKDYYSAQKTQIKECGFVTNDRWGFTIGFSPDGMVGEDGFVEVKSRNQKYQIQTIIENKVPAEYMIQIQTGLLVSERKWCDFISYSNGLPMFIKRVLPDEKIMAAIEEAAHDFEGKAKELLALYEKNSLGLIQTERRDYAMDGDIKPSSNNGYEPSDILMAG